MDNKLYIPYGIGTEKETIPGFGKKQKKHFLIGLVITAAVSIFAYLITQTIPVVVVAAILGIAASFFASRQDVYSQSIVSVVANMFAFKKSQQRYKYQYKRRF